MSLFRFVPALVLLAVSIVARPALAVTPACGTTINTPNTLVDFNADMVCASTFTGVALNITASGVTIDGKGFAITGSYARGVSGSVSNTLVKDLNVSGPLGTSSGYGVSLTGVNNRIENVTADYRDYGFLLHGSGCTLNNSRSRNGRTGAHVGETTSGGVVVTNNILTNHRWVGDQWGTSLLLTNYTGTMVLTGNDLRDSSYGIRSSSLAGTTLDNTSGGNTLGNNAVAAISVGVATNVTVRGWDVSFPSRTGYGINMTSASGTTIQNVTATGRSTGIRVDGANTTITSCTSTGNFYGIEVLTGPATVRNNNLSSNQNPGNGEANAGLYVAGFIDKALNLGGNVYTQSVIGIQVAGCRGVVIDGNTFSTPEAFWRNNNTDIYLRGSTSTDIRNLDLSSTGGRLGSGISCALASSATKITNVKANDRANGFYLDGSDGEVRNSEARRCQRALTLTGSAHTAVGNIFTDAANPADGTNAAGIMLTAYTGAVTLGGNDLRGSTAGINLRSAVVGTTLDNTPASPLTPNLMGSNFYGILVYAGPRDITVQNWDLSGTDDTGNGLYAGYLTSAITARNIVANNRSTGIYLEGAGSSCTRCTANDGLSGIVIVSAATVRDSTARNNRRGDGGAVGLQVNSYTGTLTLENNVFTGNDRGIQFARVQEATFDNQETGTSRRNDLSGSLVAGVWVSNVESRNLVLTNLDLSGPTGTRSGYGVYVTDSPSGITVQNVVARNRQFGVNMNAREVLIENLAANGNEYGAYVQTGPLTIRNSALGNSTRNDGGGAALYLYGFRGVGATMEGNDLRGSQIAIRLQQSGPITLDGRPDGKAPNLFGTHASHGIYSDSGAGPLTVRNFTFQGVGTGYGVYNETTGTAERVVASRYQYGISFRGPSSVITDSTVTDNAIDGLYMTGGLTRVENVVARTNVRYGVYLVGSGSSVRGCDLTDNTNAAFRLDGSTGQVTFAGNDLRRSGYAIYLNSTNNAAFEMQPVGDLPNVAGANGLAGFYGETVVGVTVRGPWNFDGAGSNSIGVYLSGSANTVIGARVSRRQYGVQMRGPGSTVEGVIANACFIDGVFVDQRGATVRDSQLRDNVRAGLFLSAYNGALTLEGTDFSGSNYGVYSTSAPDVAIDGAPLGRTANTFAGNFTAAVELTGNNVIVRNIDATGTGANNGVYINGVNALVENVTALNRTTGIRILGANPTVRGAYVRDSQVGVYVNGIGPVVDASRICWNSTWGVENAGIDIVDADNNFWGTASGPKMADNAGGTSNGISGRAVYRPYVTEGVGCESRLPVRTLELTGLAERPGGTAQTLRVRALDVYGAVVGGYTGMVRIVSSDGAASLGSQARLTAGIGTFAVTLRTIGTQTVSAQDVDTPQINGTTSVRVTVGPAENLTLVSGDAQSGVVARALGAPFRVRVTDVAGNGVPDVQVGFTAGTAGASVSSTAVFTDANGYAMSTGTLATLAGAHAFAASGLKADGSALTGSPIGLTATAQPGITVRLSVTGLPAQSVAGAARSFSVQALDEYSNPTPAYVGPVAFASDDARAVLPAQSSLVAGAGTFSATFKTAGTRTLGVADAAFVATKGSQQTQVIAAAAYRLALVSGNGQVVEAGTVSPEPIVVGAVDAFDNAVENTSITFAAAVAGASVATPSARTDATGRAGTLVTVRNGVGGNDFTASSTGLLGSPVRFQVIGREGPAAQLIYVSGGGQTERVRRTLLAPLVVMTADRHGNRVGNTAVSFRALSTGATVAPTVVTSDNAGLAQAFATLGQNAGLQRFEAFATFATATVPFEETAVGGDAAGLRLVSGDNQSGVVGTALALPLNVIVEDANGNPIPRVAVGFATTSPGVTITPAFVVTDATGIASATASYGERAGAISFTATSPGLANSPLTFRATARPGAGSRIAYVSGDDQTGPVTSTLGEPLVVRSTDAFGNTVSGLTVRFSALAGGAMVTPETVTTGEDGLASTVALLGTASGTHTFEAAVGEGSAQVTFEATAQPSGPASVTILDGDGQEGVVGRALANPLRVLVADAQGNPVPGATVTFATDTTGASVDTASATTDASGIASTTATLPETTGDVAITANLDATELDGVDFTATAVAGPARRLVVSGVPSPVAAGTAVEASLEAQDAFGNRATSYTGPVTLTSTDTRALLPSSVTLGDGVGVAPVTFQTAGTHVLRARDARDATISGEQSDIVVTVAPELTLVLTVPAGQQVVGTPVRFSLQVIDGFGNHVPGAHAVTIAADNDASFSGSTLGESTGLGSGTTGGLTDAQGHAELTLSTLSAGDVVVTATGDGMTSGTGTIRFSPANADRLTVKPIEGTSTLACECLGVAIQLSDAFGNDVGTALSGLSLEVSGTATITETNLASPAGTLPGAKVTGRLSARGGATATICGADAERVQVTASHPQLPGRSGTLALDFALGELSPTLSVLSADATRVQTRQGRAQVKLLPKDECGNDLGPALDVVFTTTTGKLGEVVDVGDGTYTTEFSVIDCPEPASATVSAKVGETEVGTPVTLTIECVPLSTTETTVTLTRQATPLCDDRAKSSVGVRVEPKDANGQLLGTGTSVSVAIDGLVGGTFTEAEDGSYSAEFTVDSCSATARPVTIKVNGVDVPKESLLVTFSCPAIDPIASSLEVERSEIRADGLDATKITAVAITECAEPAKGRPISFGLALGKVEAAATLDDDGRVEGSVTSAVEGLDSITATVDGTAIGTREVKYRLAVRYGGGFASCGCAGADPASLGLLAAAALLRRRRRAGARG